MSENFLPVNELEVKLLALYRKEIDMPLFIQIMLSSQISIPLDKEIDENKPNKDMNPLVIQSSKGDPVLAVFTSPERITPWISHFPEYKFALSVDCRWFLKGVTSNVGLALNPGWEYGLEFPPIGVSRLQHDFGIK